GLEATNNLAWTQGFGNLPPRLAHRETASWKSYEKAHPLVAAFVEAQLTSEALYDGPGAAFLWGELSRATEAVTLGTLSPRQALDQAAASGQQILNRERSRAQ